jgi:hypothetical protein
MKNLAESESAVVLRFPPRARAMLHPCPRKADGSLFIHGEFTADRKLRYCADHDVFWPAHWDRACFTAPGCR